MLYAKVEKTFFQAEVVYSPRSEASRGIKKPFDVRRKGKWSYEVNLVNITLTFL
jgi:hypothetical protein